MNISPSLVQDSIDRMEDNAPPMPHEARLPFDGIFKIAYNKSDSVNPYTCKTATNFMLTNLLYEGLVRLTPDWNCELILADTITRTSPTSFSIEIKSGRQFTNGEPITSQDVINSLRMAKTYGSNYYRSLLNIDSYYAVSDTEIAIHLRSPDAFFENLLDFPIIKISDGNIIGSGRYIFDKEAERLRANPRRTGGLKEILLVSAEGHGAHFYALRQGDLTLHYDRLDDRDTQLTGFATAKMPMTNIVYLGLNQNRRVLRDRNSIQAISAAIDKDSIVSIAYLGRAEKTDYPIPASHHLYAQLEASNKPALQLSDDIIETTLHIIYNEENTYKKYAAEIISENLWSIGISTTVTGVPNSVFRERLARDNYDLYIGEVSLNRNFDITPLISTASLISFGAIYNEVLLNDYYAFREGAKTKQEFYTDNKYRLPFIPLLFRSGVVAFSRRLTNTIAASPTDVFYNIEQWNVGGA
jgi:peptide/nickel transport system substrate-binding protein